MTRPRGEDALARRLAAHIEKLCLPFPDRDVGGPGNRAANAYFAAEAEALGLEVERIGFECVRWEPGRADLSVGGLGVEAFPGPYSLPFDGEAPLVTASTLDELSALDAPGSVLLLHGAIAASQLTPKRYPFYAFEEHARIIEELERQAPAAIVAATGKDPMVGDIHPFPLFEDADFDIPSAFVRDADGERLLPLAGERASLTIASARVPARSEQLVARRAGRGTGRVLVSAHIDTRRGTPGALDNATGVACLLGLAACLPLEPSERTLELLPFNGEDNYAAPGEVAYVAANPRGFGDVVLEINLDAPGFREGATSVSFYGCDDALRDAILTIAARHDRVVEGAPWHQGDHMIFAMRDVPALALTSQQAAEIGSGIAHTDRDVPELADAELLAETCRFLGEVVREVGG